MGNSAQGEEGRGYSLVQTGIPEIYIQLNYKGAEGSTCICISGSHVTSKNSGKAHATRPGSPIASARVLHNLIRKTNFERKS
jgi:hypothetical protein